MRLAFLVPSTRRTLAFTLSELLCVIALLAILISLAMPALSRARNQARTLRQLHNGTSCAFAMQAYATDFTDGFLFPQVPAQPWLAVALEGRPRDLLSYFRAGRQFWPNFMPPGYLSIPTIELDQGHDAARNADHDLPAGTVWSDYQATQCLFAAREYWESSTSNPAPSWFRGVRVSDVVFPSQKLLVCRTTEARALESPAASTVLPVAFADGSGSLWTPAEIRPLAPAPSTPLYGLLAVPVLTTPSGLAGRDRAQ
jgi:prepilin-type N-terminal cleavage/methylation domain-containing protein